jgi:osmotically-inducible protein OsmY
MAEEMEYPNSKAGENSFLDSDIKQRIIQDLRKANIDLSNVEMVVENAEVRLMGSVETNSDKENIEEITGKSWGVKKVENHLQVKDKPGLAYLVSKAATEITRLSSESEEDAKMS